MRWLFFVVALTVGALITLQTGSNAGLKEALRQPLMAVIISSSIGVVALLGIVLAGRWPWPSSDQLMAAPWWAWLGGVLGAAYAIAVVVLARPLGATTLTALVVTGQLLCSVILDHFGWIGFETHTASVLRLAGCALMIAGFVLIARF